MSPRAAWRLEALGFGRVFDYLAGKADWGSFGLPLEGVRGSATRVGAYVRRDVPICCLDDRLHEVRKLVQATEFDVCIVVNDERVVLGVLGRRALAREDDVAVEEAMTAGPSTVRPSLALHHALERMRRQDLTTLPVTRSDGVLVGPLVREDAAAALDNRA